MKLGRKILIFAVLAVFVIAALYAVIYMASLGSTAGDALNVVDLYNDPEKYDVENAEGIAEIIISEDLDKTGSVNAVTAVVFDFRGYDTIGESFVLLTAISGSMVILRKAYDKKKARTQKNGTEK